MRKEKMLALRNLFVLVGIIIIIGLYNSYSSNKASERFAAEQARLQEYHQMKKAEEAETERRAKEILAARENAPKADYAIISSGYGEGMLWAQVHVYVKDVRKENLIAVCKDIRENGRLTVQPRQGFNINFYKTNTVPGSA